MKKNSSGCAGCAAVAVLGLVGLCIFSMMLRSNSLEALDEADKLYASGNQAEAVSKYKENHQFASSRPRIFQRIVEYELEQGHTAEAEKWVNKALDMGASVSYENDAAKGLLAKATQERRELAAQREAARLAREKAQRQRKDRETIRITAPKLLAEYQANEVAADEAYKGKKLEVKGVVLKVAKDLLDDMYVTLKSGKEFDIFTVQCSFDDDHEEALAAVQPGAIVTIRGTCDGKLGNVFLKDCEFK